MMLIEADKKDENHSDTSGMDDFRDEGKQIKLILTISCQNLPNKDKGSFSDPMVVVYSNINGSEEEWNEEGRTEFVKDNLNPRFTEKIKFDYNFSVKHILKFVVYDVDSAGENEDPRNAKYLRLEEQEYIGETIISVHEIVSRMHANKKLIDMTQKIPQTLPATLFVSVDKADTASNDTITFKIGSIFSGYNVKNSKEANENGQFII